MQRRLSIEEHDVSILQMSFDRVADLQPSGDIFEIALEADDAQYYSTLIADLVDVVGTRMPFIATPNAIT